MRVPDTGPPWPPPPDRTFTVPHQHPRSGTHHSNMLPPNGIEVHDAARRDQHRAGPPRIPTPSSTLLRGRGPDLAVSDGTTTSGNQKSHCAISPARQVVRDAGWRQIHRPQLFHPLTRRSDRMRPPDPFGDHRRRHPRIDRLQLPGPRLRLIDHRPSRRPLILRRLGRALRS